MSGSWDDFRDEIPLWIARLIVAGGMLLLVWALCSLPSCATAEAVAALPEGYWMSTWMLVEALLTDLWSVVRFVFPV